MAEIEPDGPYIPNDIRTLYEVHNYRNAAQVLATGCRDEFGEILEALRSFRLTIADIRKPGGNEFDIPKRISLLLRKKGWAETRIKGDLMIARVIGTLKKSKKKPSVSKAETEEQEEIDELEAIEELKRQGRSVEEIKRANFLDGHKADYVKKRVAFDLEWNSKDQTFDRDLYAFRAFHECDLIDAAVLLTRSGDLNESLCEVGARTRRKDGRSEAGQERQAKAAKNEIWRKHYMDGKTSLPFECRPPRWVPRSRPRDHTQPHHRLEGL